MDRQAKHLLEFGPFRMDLEERVLMRDQETITLSPKAFETLLVLVQHSERVVLKDDLMKMLWPDTFVEEANLSQHIFQLRKALGDKAHDPEYIVTVPGRGYRFAQKVEERIESDGDLVVHSRSVQRVTVEETESSGAVASFSGHRRKYWVWAGAAVALILIAGFTGYGLYRWAARTSSPSLERLRFTKITSSGKAEDAAISPDGNYIVYSQRDGKGSGLWLHHVTNGSDVQILP